MRRLIKSWLKAGVVDWSGYANRKQKKETNPTLEGTPQGGVIYQQLRGWAVTRHKGSKIKASKEWKSVGTRNWVFTSYKGHTLIRHSDTKIIRHIKVEGARTPYDGDWIYWSARQGTYPGVNNQAAKLIKEQGGKCHHCGLYFAPDTLAEIHHKDGNHNNNKQENLALVHGHCHDTIHASPIRTKRDLSTTEEWIDAHPF